MDDLISLNQIFKMQHPICKKTIYLPNCLFKQLFQFYTVEDYKKPLCKQPLREQLNGLVWLHIRHVPNQYKNVFVSLTQEFKEWLLQHDFFKEYTIYFLLTQNIAGKYLLSFDYHQTPSDRWLTYFDESAVQHFLNYYKK